MANTRGAVMTKVAAGTTPDPGSVAATVRAFTEIVTFASQASGDTIEVAKLPKGARVLHGVLTTSASTGTATLAVGTSSSAAKYRAAAVLTATDTPTPFGVATALNVANSAEETVVVTVGTAALPASGTMAVTTVYTFD